MGVIGVIGVTADATGGHRSHGRCYVGLGARGGHRFRSMILFLYKHSAARERALREGGPERYHLYGLPEVGEAGFRVEAGSFSQGGGLVRLVAPVFRRACHRRTGYSGNFPQTLANWSAIRRADAVILTSNNVSIPFLFLRRLGVRLPPALAISSGLEAHVPDVASGRRAAVARLFNAAERILVFAESERDFLRDRVGVDADRLVAVPFGIPERYLPVARASADEPDWDVVTVGADALRDMPMLFSWAAGHPETKVLVVAGSELLRTLDHPPSNVRVESDLSLSEVFDRLARCRAAVVPVRENRYSAGTTFLVHALAAGLPVLAAATSALGPLYRADESGALWYRPGDADGFATGMRRLLSLSPDGCDRLSQQGRAWVGSVANGRPMLEEIGAFLSGVTQPSGK